MNRMWEIREHDTPKYGYRMGRRSPEKELEEAYECGFEDGYEKAMKEIHFSERKMR